MNSKNILSEQYPLDAENLFDLSVLLERIYTSCLQKINDNKLEFSFDSEEVSAHLVRGDVDALEKTLTALTGQVFSSVVEGSVSIKMNLMIRSGQYFIVRFRMFVTEVLPNSTFSKIDQQKDDGSFRTVKKEIERLGGSLEYNETSKGGKIYTLVLPFEDSGEKKPIAADVDSVQGELLRTITILLVSESEEDERLFKPLFEKWKCKYLIKRDLIQIAEAVANDKPDVILLNINRNEQEFRALNLRISKNSNIDIPTIAFSEISTSSAIKQKLGDYCNKLIIKPFDSVHLKELIIRLLESNIQKPDPRNKCFNRN